MRRPMSASSHQCRSSNTSSRGSEPKYRVDPTTRSVMARLNSSPSRISSPRSPTPKSDRQTSMCGSSQSRVLDDPRELGPDDVRSVRVVHARDPRHVASILCVRSGGLVRDALPVLPHATEVPRVVQGLRPMPIPMFLDLFDQPALAQTSLRDQGYHLASSVERLGDGPPEL